MSFRLADSRMLRAACCRMVSLSGPTKGVTRTRISLQERSDAPKWTANVGSIYTVPTRIGKVTATAQYSYTSRAYASVFEAAPIDVLGSHSLLTSSPA
jgi:hypothetical protein